MLINKKFLFVPIQPKPGRHVEQAVVCLVCLGAGPKETRPVLSVLATRREWVVAVFHPRNFGDRSVWGEEKQAEEPVLPVCKPKKSKIP